MSLTPEQVRAATGLLGITQTALSEATGITRANLSRFEQGHSQLRTDTMAKLTGFFDDRGVHFTDKNGVEFAEKEKEIKYYGHNGFVAFMKDVYEVVKEQGGDVCVSNVNERNWIRWMTEELYQEHSVRMRALNNFQFKILVEEGDNFFIADKFAEYRYIPSQYFNDQSFYAYGDKLALMAFEEDQVRINVIQSKGWSDSYRQLFNFAWSVAKTAKSKSEH